VYTAAEVRDLLLLLRAADDPTDRLALVASLRSPLYGCSDVELLDWRRRDGRWSIWWVPPDELADHPVARAIAHIRSIAERIGSVAPADLLAAVADERRVFDLALDRPDRRDVWRRLRFVIEQARAWADAGGHGVRRYLAWCKLQASDGRIAETILPEHDADAVRIMTVHASKGLEFPITIVGGMTTQPSGNRGTRAVFSENDWMLTGSGDDGRFDAYKPIDEQMSDAERRRLLYVACTRAVDHLVVSIHRAVPKSSNADYADETALTSAELLAKHDAASVGSSRSFHPEPLAPPERTPLELDWSDPEAWAREREGALRVAGRRSTVAATRLVDDLHAEQVEVVEDPGLDKRPVNLDLAPWRRGRYGTSIGRAVHGVLQFCDLATGHDIATLARAQCAAEGIIGLDDRVAALARSAIQAPLVRSVVDGAPHWRELFVAAPIGSRLLEGYVDLLVRTPDGLVIVDYKTDRWSGPAQTGERVARYRVQLAAYGVALEQALGEPISGGVLIRCIPDTAAEQIRIADWADALDEVRTLVS
jgi:ATP-dependent helicase/nuclease subunit A